MHRDKLLPLATLFLGCGGCYLNNQLHIQGVDSATQLLSSSHYPTTLLLLTALVVLVMGLGTIRGTSHRGAEANLHAPSILALSLWRLGSIALALGAGCSTFYVIQQFSLRSQGYGTAIPYTLCLAAILSLVASIGQLTMVKYLSTGECPPKLGTMSTLVAFSALPWLLYCYQLNTRNPVIALYGYQLVGLSTAAVALYLTATLFYGKSTPKVTAFLSLVGGYLLITSVCFDDPTYLYTSSVALAAILLGNASVILKNMNSKKIIDNQQEGTD